MVRKFALMLATAAAVGGAAFIPATASAGHRGDVRHDIRDIHRDRVDLRHDKRELRRDVGTGHYRAAQRELTDIRHDRRDLRHDYRDLGRDVYRRGY